MRPTEHLDLSTMVARVLLAVLTAGTVVLLGLWLRASDALSFVSTMLAVAGSQLIATTLRGERIGPPTAASRRFQPVVDAIAAYPGGKVFGKSGFKRGANALLLGLLVATLTAIVSEILFASLVMAPLWRSTLALGLVLLPVNLWLAYSRSRNEYSGTRFASSMLAAIGQVVRPEAADKPATSPWDAVSPGTRSVVIGVLRTAMTLVGRIAIQLLIPLIFSTWISIAAVGLGVVTLIAGGPVFAALGKSMRAAQAAEAAPATNTGIEPIQKGS